MKKNIVEKVSAGGVIHYKGKYLVIKWLSQGTFELPKGKIEPGETAEDACVREVFEETGYNVAIISPLSQSDSTFDWHDGRTIHQIVHYFLLERTDELEATPNREENEDFENYWLTADEACNSLSFDHMKTACQQAIAFIDEHAA